DAVVVQHLDAEEAVGRPDGDGDVPGDAAVRGRQGADRRSGRGLPIEVQVRGVEAGDRFVEGDLERDIRDRRQVGQATGCPGILRDAADVAGRVLVDRVRLAAAEAAVARSGGAGAAEAVTGWVLDAVVVDQFHPQRPATGRGVDLHRVREAEVRAADVAEA